MPAAAIATLVVAGLLVAALAVVLVWVVLLLLRLDRTLGDVHSRVSRVAEQTAPLEDGVTAINADLRAVADALAGLVRRVEGGSPVR